jgi:threonine synthase
MFDGLAPDGSLYIPASIPKLSADFLNKIEQRTLHEIGVEVAAAFIDEIPRTELEGIAQRAWSFPIPLVHLEDRIYLLKLFHGPTLAFKDVGAGFMAEVMSYFLASSKREITILVATSGDTGSAVAHGFYNIPNISVVVLYPSGKISPLQEKQITTLGGNIRAIEVKGTFDDCQRMVKQAFADKELQQNRALTTANSINIARLIPQMVYYFWGMAQLKHAAGSGFEKPVVTVPSGNFGNLTAAMYSKWMGNPIESFIAATNANDVVPEYLRTGKFTPRASVQTFSNAMDVGNPSNLARMQALYGNNVQQIRDEIEAVSISDQETLEEIRATYESTGYIADPHTAVGIAATRKIMGHRSKKPPIIIAATAHPAKFPEVIEKAIGIKVPLPKTLEEAMKWEKKSILIGNNYEELKEILQ